MERSFAARDISSASTAYTSSGGVGAPVGSQSASAATVLGKVSTMTGFSKLKYIMRTMGARNAKAMKTSNGTTSMKARILFLRSALASAALRLWPPMTS